MTGDDEETAGRAVRVTLVGGIVYLLLIAGALLHKLVQHIS
jgi:hypothetical protein